MVPSSAAMALPTLPARTMAQITGVSSLVNANPSNPPITRVKPTLLNSLQNWIVNTIPTNEEVNMATPSVSGPTRAICCSVCCMFSFLCHTTRFTTKPSNSSVYNVRHKNLGGSHVLSASFKYSATASPAASSCVASSELPSYFVTATTALSAWSSPAAVASPAAARATDVQPRVRPRPVPSTDPVKHVRRASRLGRRTQAAPTSSGLGLKHPNMEGPGRRALDTRGTIGSARARATTGTLIPSVAMPWTR
mmetsp:Transcript_4199/g.15416  ORF Transcript_4199/g.15416 Transcript_4199/m.15416 type:complete len:251 (-) Transcript_4199:34-786(-)